MVEAMAFPTMEVIESMHQQLSRYVHRTPVVTSSYFDDLTGAHLYFKCEQLQKIGAFKMRGATVALMHLKKHSPIRKVYTHSSGNHAQALSLAAKLLGFEATIVMPHNTSKVKVDAVKGYGGNIVFCEVGYVAREAKLAEIAAQGDSVFVPPFDDDQIIIGQSTVAKELIEQTEKLDVIVAPVGGGGLLSGTSLSAHYFSPDTIVYGVEPSIDNDAWKSFNSGQVQQVSGVETIAEGLRTSLSERTLSVIREHVADILLVTEEEIVSAMRQIWERMKLVVEPSAAVAVAGILRYPELFRGKEVGVILTGGNVDVEKLPF